MRKLKRYWKPSLRCRHRKMGVGVDAGILLVSGRFWRSDVTAASDWRLLLTPISHRSDLTVRCSRAYKEWVGVANESFNPKQHEPLFLDKCQFVMGSFSVVLMGWKCSDVVILTAVHNRHW